MDPTIIVALLVTVQILWQAWSKYKETKLTTTVDTMKVNVEGDVALAGIVDKRLEGLLERQDSRIAALEKELQELERRFDRAVTYMRENHLPWPPVEE